MSSLPQHNPSQAVWVEYRNYQGDTDLRHIVPLNLYHGSSQWHPEPGWLLEVVDLEKQAVRTFSVKDILAWGCSAKTGAEA